MSHITSRIDTGITTREQFIEEAAKHGIELKPWDFTGPTGNLYLDGMPADQWLDAMTDDS